MKELSKEIWKCAEEISCSFLERNGFLIICRNYSCEFGEIDIVAEKDQVIVFAEVRSRSSDLQSAFSSVSVRKRLKIIRTAIHFLQDNRDYEGLCMRFDVIGILYNERSNLFQIKHLEDAFRVDELDEYL
ncbi:MAG: YraN family protein [Candidatus Cloacimonetes bacterium]|nr:YraN family protein [Candidatus Cloacimonadota bacterium]